jgi:hypothetical protein
MRNRSDSPSVFGFARRFNKYLARVGFGENFSVVVPNSSSFFVICNSVFPVSSLIYRTTDCLLFFLRSFRKDNIEFPTVKDMYEHINIAIITSQNELPSKFLHLSGNNFVVVFEKVSSISSLPFLNYVCDQDRNFSFRIDSFKDSRIVGSRFVRIPNNKSHIILEQNVFAAIIENVIDFSFEVTTKDYNPLGYSAVHSTRRSNMNLLLIRKATAQILIQTFGNFFKVFAHKKANWHISCVNLPTKKVTDIPNPKNRWLADPFLFQNKDEFFIFAEDFDVRSGLGSISVATISNSSPSSFEICHYENFHISFPRLFSFNSKIYGSLESSEVGGIRIYEISDFPNNWNLISNFFSDRIFVDPIIFDFKGTWVLLATEKTKFGNDFFTNLNIFASSNPVLGPWISAEVNPVLSDCEIGRNGGLFELEGKIYRVAQRFRKGIYGSEITIFQVLDADVLTYKEQMSESLSCDVAQLKPGIARQFHTYNQLHDLAVFDWK